MPIETSTRVATESGGLPDFWPRRKQRRARVMTEDRAGAAIMRAADRRRCLVSKRATRLPSATTRSRSIRISSHARQAVETRSGASEWSRTEVVCETGFRGVDRQTRYRTSCRVEAFRSGRRALRCMTNQVGRSSGLQSQHGTDALGFNQHPTLLRDSLWQT